MLFIDGEQNLGILKKKFFNTNINFIQRHMPDSIVDYVESYLNDKSPSIFVFYFKSIFQLQSYLTQEEKRLYCSVIYVCLRELDYYWKDFFHFIQVLASPCETDFNKSFTFENSKVPQSDLYNIRQCRTDKPPYTYDEYINIGFYNKNENFTYHCYDDVEARNYFVENCSPEVLSAYNNIEYPQAKSDFFLIASLYTEGGISADVCSVAQTNIELLIKNTNCLFIYDEKGLHKKFLYANKQNPFILYHLNYMINKMSQFGQDQDYENFSSRLSFQKNFMDYYAFYHEYSKNIPLTFIHNDNYTAFVDANDTEEKLPYASKFPYAVAKGFFREFHLEEKAYRHNISQSTYNNFYMPTFPYPTIIGKNVSSYSNDSQLTSYTLPSLDVWKIRDIRLSGYGWVWQNDHYISFESYLSNLAFDQKWIEKFKIPNSSNITRIIEEECIIGISAGYASYGHYIIDDLPRLGLIKDRLGNDFYNKKIIISLHTPQWARELLKFFLKIQDENFLEFDENNEILHINNAILSSSISKENYNFHNYIREFYLRYSKTQTKPHRLICLSRNLLDPETENKRIFNNRKTFEDLARSHGFEIIHPELLSIEEQILMMSQTICQIGEYGAAQHSSVFNSYGMIVGSINPIDNVQFALGRIYNDTNIACYADHIEKSKLNDNILSYDLEYSKIKRFIEVTLSKVESFHNH